MEPVATAPAPTESTPETMPAADAAVIAEDFSAFEQAEFAKVAGKPLEPVPAPERTLSKRQQDANERTQKAVEAATADLRAENERLKAAAAPKPAAPVAPPAAAAPVAAPKAERFQSFETYVAKNPEATLEDYMDARDEFRDQQRERTATQHAESQATADTESARATRVQTALRARQTDDPAFLTKVNPRILEFKSIADSQAAGVPVTPGSLVLEEMMGSDHFLAFADHFTAHPDALATLEAVPAHLAHLPPRQRAVEHGRWIVRQMGKLEDKLAPAAAAPAAAAAVVEPPPPSKKITSAPPPPTDISSRHATPTDSVEAAVKALDYPAFEAAEFARLEAKRK